MNSCMAAAGQAASAITNMAFHSLALFPDRAKARNLIRLAHAVHHLAYMEFGAKLANRRSWEMLLDRHLLTPEEVAYLKDRKDVGSAKTMHVLSWAVQLVAREVKEGRLAAPHSNLFLAELMSLRSGCGGFKSQTENPIPYGYMFVVNLLLYCWALSVGLFFAGNLSVYGSVAYALVVYIFFSVRLIGIQLSEPFGYEARHLPVPENLMRAYMNHRELLSDAFPPLGASGTVLEGVAPPDLCAPLEAKYDRTFMANFKGAECNKQMAFAQQRFGFPGITDEDRDKGTGSTVLAVPEVPEGPPDLCQSRGSRLAAGGSSWQ
jgi:predicted membrane chloride channel (bestrophin family)